MNKLLVVLASAVLLLSSCAPPCATDARAPAPCATDADCGGIKCILPADAGSALADGGTNRAGYCDVKETCG